MDTAIIIPARYDSSRFPGKPLVDILGKSMIERVWGQCIKVLSPKNIFIATDSNKIFDHCISKGMQPIMTSNKCLTGTDRVYEASEKIDAKTIINVQGDEPLISPNDLNLVINESRNNPSKIINAMCAITDESEFRNLSIPKVIFDQDMKLLYMSRAPIPNNKDNSFEKAWKQVCIYAFPKNYLKIFANYGKRSVIESIEDLEILRFLELGYEVKMIEVSKSSIAVDFEDDVLKVEKAIRERNL